MERTDAHVSVSVESKRLSALELDKVSLVRKADKSLFKCQFNLPPVCVSYVLQSAPFTRSTFNSMFLPFEKDSFIVDRRFMFFVTVEICLTGQSCKVLIMPQVQTKAVGGFPR